MPLLPAAGGVSIDSMMAPCMPFVLGIGHMNPAGSPFGSGGIVSVCSLYVCSLYGKRLFGVRRREMALAVAVTYYFEANGREPIHSKGVLGSGGKVDDAAGNERPAVVYAHSDVVAGFLILYHYDCSERQRFVGGGNAHMVVSFTVRRDLP